MAIYKSSMRKVDLTGGIVRDDKPVVLALGDKMADRFGVEVFRNGAEVSLPGVSCKAYFVRPSGDTVPINGSVSENKAWVDLPEACYAYEGQFSLAVLMVGGGITGTMRIIDGVVKKNATDTIVNPGTVVPSVAELLALIDECEAATEAAEDAVEGVSYLFEDENVLIPTEGADTTNNGVRRRTDGADICISGEATATRRYMMWGGFNATYTASTNSFRRTLRKGTYKFKISSTGDVNISTVRATYDIFQNEFTISDGDIVTLTADAVIGIYINNGTNYGVYGEESETRVRVEAIEMTAKDNVSRRAVWEKTAYIKQPGELSVDGYPHQAFPDVVYANGNELIISRVAQSHYASDDPADWGGMSIEKVTVSAFQDGTNDLQGQIGGNNANPTPDGRYLLISGWTTYNTSSHDNYLALVKNDTFEVVSYLVNPCIYNTTKISLEGKPLFTPTGHILVCGYRGANVYISRSDQTYGAVAFENMTFTTQRIEAMAGGYNESSIGYTKDKLYILARNETNNGAAGLFECEDLEGIGSWTNCQVTIRDHNGAASAIHEPKLLPMCADDGILWFAGANYRDATLRRAVLGFIDLNKKEGWFGIIGDGLNYGGYTGFMKFCETEFDVAYYAEGTGGPSDPTTAISSALMYKRVNARKVVPQICHYL